MTLQMGMLEDFVDGPLGDLVVQAVNRNTICQTVRTMALCGDNTVDDY